MLHTPLHSAEELALGTRLKRLSDRLFADVDDAYRDLGFDVQGRWFGLLYLLLHNGPMGVSALADEMGQTHSAVSQLSKRLEKEGWVTSTTDPADSRRRLLRLSDDGRARVRQLQPVWRSVTAAVNGLLQDANASSLLPLVARLERQLDDTPLRQAVLDRHARQRADEVQVVTLDDAMPTPHQQQVTDAFRRLNIAWLEKYFYVEEHDDHVLSNPRGCIVDPGGHVFAAFVDDEVVGVGALMPHGDEMELTKMAVTPSAQGLGIGERLVGHAVDLWRASSSSTLFLESSQRLKPALKLYEKMGFKHQAQRRPGSKYTRSDVYMVFDDDDAAS